MKTKKKLQRFLSIILTCVMVLNIPTSAFAYNDVQFAAESNVSSEANVPSEESVSSEETLFSDGKMTESVTDPEQQLFSQDTEITDSSETEFEVTADGDGDLFSDGMQTQEETDLPFKSSAEGEETKNLVQGNYEPVTVYFSLSSDAEYAQGYNGDVAVF